MAVGDAALSASNFNYKVGFNDRTHNICHCNKRWHLDIMYRRKEESVPVRVININTATLQPMLLQIKSQMPESDIFLLVTRYHKPCCKPPRALQKDCCLGHVRLNL